MTVGKPLGGVSAPSHEAGQLAATLLEIREMSPEHLARIESAALAYHAEKESSDKRAKEVQEARDALAAAEAVRNSEVRADTAELDTRQSEVSVREGRCLMQEQAIAAREKAVAEREQAVADGERRIGRMREQLAGVGQ